MCRRLLHLILCGVVLGMVMGTAASAASLLNDPDIIGWWECNEGEGSVVSDSSANGNDGTFVNGDPVWVAGVRGSAVELTNPTLVEIPTLNVTLTEATFAGWMKPYGSQPSWSSFFMTRGGGTHGFNVLDNFQLAYHWNDDSASWSYRGGDYVVDNEWTFAALTVTPSAATFYVNGVQGSTNSITHAEATFGMPLYLGGDGDSGQAGRRMTGALDDMSFFSRALSPAEVADLMAGAGNPALAGRPSPEDAADDVVLDITLSWTAGEYVPATDGHKLFFSDVFDDVNDGAAAADRGVVSDPSFEVTALPFILDFGTTYYWRIDEANSVTGWDVGPVWSFTTEPFAYPVEGITVSTNTVPSGEQVPEYAVDGSGLNADDQHSSANGMWAGKIPADEPAYLQLDLPRVYKLHEMKVWNYNHSFEMIIGASAKDVTIEYSADGAEWMALGDFVFAQGSGSSTYTANTTVPFDGVAAQHVRMTFNSSYVSTSLVGLSELRLTYIPSFAREPKPADAATDVVVGTSLNWRSARDAVSNEVSVSMDPNALVLAGTTSGAGLDAGPFDLDSTYYWQVVSDDGTGLWASDVWSFDTQPYIEIDGFESYDDDVDAGTTIWQTWVDGYEDASNGGSLVGNDPSPFAELTIVHSGDQSLPLFYENGNASAISETDYTVSPAQDWTTSNIKSLSLWFHGAQGNAGNLYVKINNTKVPYHGDPANIATQAWLPWTIDLAATGANLSSVSMLSIGIEGTGAGVIYVDDVRLYPKIAQSAEPVQPGTENLVAHYTFENNANDVTGNGYNGTVNGAPMYAAGMTGNALVLDGATDFIEIESVGIDPCLPRTIAGWAKSDIVPTTGWANIFGFTGPGTNGNHFDIEWVGDSGDVATLGYYGLHRHGWERDILPIDMEWHHLAATFDGDVIAWYGDGQQMGSEPLGTTPAVLCPGAVNIGKRQDNEVFFDGSIDDVRIYDVALTPGEIAGLAGRTETMLLPF